MEDRREPPLAQQPSVVRVEVVGDEDRRRCPSSSKTSRMARLPPRSSSRRRSPGAPRAARTRSRMVASRPSVSVTSCSRPVRRQLPHRGAEAGLPLLLAVERRAAQGHQHRSRAPRPVRDQVGSGRPGRAVVHPDVRRAAAGREVGDERDDRDAAAASRATAATTSGWSGALRITPSEPRCRSAPGPPPRPPGRSSR